MADLRIVPPLKPTLEDQLRDAWSDRSALEREVQRRRDIWVDHLHRRESPTAWFLPLGSAMGVLAKHLDLCPESPSAALRAREACIEVQGIARAVHDLLAGEDG